VIDKKKVVIASAIVLCIAGTALIFGMKGKNSSASASDNSATALASVGAKGTALIENITAPLDLSAYSQNQDEYMPMTVKKAFIDDGGCAKVIVHNNTNTPIVGYDLTIVYFDENGSPVGERADFSVSDIIVSAGFDFGLDTYVGGNGGGSYIKAFVKSLKYGDGTAWENDNIEASIAVNCTAFNVDEYNESIAKNEENVEKAAEVPYITINEMTISNIDEMSSRKDLKLVITNSGSKEVTEVKFAVAEFASDNSLLDVSPQIYIGKNVRLATCSSMDLKVGESRSLSSAAFLEKDCCRINAIVTEITFADGTVWKNPYTLDWLLWFM
jgi:hypothetical protein